MPKPVVLRPYTSRDAPALTAIYAHYVATSTVTFDTEPPLETNMRDKFDAMAAHNHPVIVAEREGTVLGFAYASTYRDRPAYRFTCEDTLYLAPQATGMGIGSRLLEQLITEARDCGFCQMLAVIEASAASSVRLHEKFDFAVRGRYPDLGFKFDRWLDIVHMQLELQRH